MSEWVVRRWARYGHERLYVEGPDGISIGHFDVKSGRYHATEIVNLPPLEEAIVSHLGQRPAASVISADESRNVPAQEPDHADRPAAEPDQPWVDLSSVPPGAAARRRALEEREAQGKIRHALARMIGVKTDERAWRIGADGEHAVAQQLWGLQPEWRFLHAVPVGSRDSDIDHVAIGPGGVFTINTKNHPRAAVWVGGETFMVNGQRVPYIRNSRHEAQRATKLLTAAAGFPISAAGIIVVVGARRGYTVKNQPKDGSVVVVRRTHISNHLITQPARLTPDEVEAIYEAARRSTTWR